MPTFQNITFTGAGWSTGYGGKARTNDLPGTAGDPNDPTVYPTLFTGPASNNPNPVDQVDWETPRKGLFGATYVGLCRLSNSNTGNNNKTSFSQGIFSLTDSRFFVSGFANNGIIAEFDYPTFSDVPLNTSAPIVGKKSSFGDWLQVGDPGGWTQSNGYIDGIFDNGTELFVTSAPPYDAGSTEWDENLSRVQYDRTIDQFYPVKDNARMAGYMGRIPPEWQTAFGAAYFMGSNNNTSIVKRHSVGPSLYSWDGTTAGAINATRRMVFPVENSPNFPAGDYPLGSHHLEAPVGNPMWNQETKTRLAFFWGDDYYVFAVTEGLYNEIKYLPSGYYADDEQWATDNNVPNADNWAYFMKFRVQDILAAANPWDVRPYDYGRIQWPMGNSGIDSPQAHFWRGYFDDQAEMLYVNAVLDYPGGPSSDKTHTVFAYDWSTVPKERHS